MTINYKLLTLMLLFSTASMFSQEDNKNEFLVSPFGWENSEEANIYLNKTDLFIRERIRFLEDKIAIELTGTLTYSKEDIRITNKDFFLVIDSNSFKIEVIDNKKFIVVDISEYERLFFVADKAEFNTKIKKDRSSIYFRNDNYHNLLSPAEGYLSLDGGPLSVEFNTFETKSLLIYIHDIKKGTATSNSYRYGEYISTKYGYYINLDFTDKEDLKAIRKFLLITIKYY